MTSKISNLIVLCSLFATSAFAQVQYDEATMIETTSSSKSVMVLESTVNQSTGESEPAVVAIKDRKTGSITIVGIDKDPTEAKVKALLAFRLKFPELLGIRIGANINQVVDIGFEAGYGVFFNSLGGFINVYPAGKSKNSIRNLYLGGRLQKELIFAIFAWAEGTRAEAIAGYKFDKKPGGLHSFIEAGIGAQTNNMNGQTIFDSSTQTFKEIEPYTAPIVIFGIGWTFPSNN